MPVHGRGAACRRACIPLLPALLLVAACQGPGLAPRYEALAGDLASASTAAGSGRVEEDPFPGAATLARDVLVAEVLRRNPGLAAARLAWRGALARVPQARALEDPTLGYAVGPASFGSSAVDDAHRVELRQAFPFPGKRALRGEVALAGAEATAHEFAASQLRLTTLASLLYDDYYLAARALEVNDHHAELLEELHAVATARYEAGEASAQAPLRAEFERAELEREHESLASDALLVRAQLNALLHRLPEAPLPPPPATLVPADSGAFDRETSLADRPELRAADARVRAAEAAVGLARREFLPDFALTAGYDGFWEVSELRPMLGVELNVPLQLGRRRAALEEAHAELERARREREGLVDELRLAIASAEQRVAEASRVLALYRDRLLPAASDQLEAARAAFESGQESFLAVLAAEEDLREVELGEHRALAALDRQQALLVGATGAPMQP